METVIGLDIGTQSTKALVIDARGRIIAQHSQGYRVTTPQPLWAEQWPQVWWDAVITCLHGCLAQPGVDARSVKALCVSSLYGGSGIPVDAQIEPIHPCLIWMDRRAEPQVEWIRGHLDLDALQRITGNGVDSYYGYTKMLWIKQQRPDVWAKTRYLLPPNSYINYHLCGEIAIDHSSAGNIGGIYDLDARGWSSAMIDALGLDRQKLPERLVDSGEIIGGLHETLADSLGVAPGTAVLGGGVDAAMATLAAGATQPGHHVAMIGTSMCWGLISQRVEVGQKLISMPHVLNSQRDIYTFGGALTAGASVSWFVDTFCGEAPAMADVAEEPFARLETPARELPQGADGLLFLPYLMGERSPVWDAKASAGFIGLSLFHQRHHLYRAVLEGVSFALRHNIQAAGHTDPPLAPELVVVGGATRSDLWMQIIADVTGMPVHTFSEDVEAAFGAGLLAAQAAGLFHADRPPQRTIPALRAEPSHDAMTRYEALFAIYCELYPTLRPAMHRLNALRDTPEPTR